MLKIAEKIKINLDNNINGFSSISKIGKWYNYEPYISFSNKKWEKSSSCVVFCIRNHKAGEMNFTIHIDFFHKYDISLIDTDDLLKKYVADVNKYENKADGSNIWRVMWKYNNFEIEKVSERIVELMTILKDYEANKHDLNHQLLN